MFEVKGGDAQVGGVTVSTTNNTGLSVDHWAERCLQRIVHVAEDSDSVIKEQALAFREDIREVIRYHMQQAIKSDRTTLHNLFIKQGHEDMSRILWRL